MTIDFAHLGQWMGIHFSKMISFGNGAGLRETEMLRYLGEDHVQVSLPCMSVTQWPGIFSTLSEVSSKKPVILLKGGLSDAGQRRGQPYRVAAAREQSGNRCVNATQSRPATLTTLPTCLAFCTSGRITASLVGGGALGVAAADIVEFRAVHALRDVSGRRLNRYCPDPARARQIPSMWQIPVARKFSISADTRGTRQRHDIIILYNCCTIIRRCFMVRRVCAISYRPSINRRGRFRDKRMRQARCHGAAEPEAGHRFH